MCILSFKNGIWDEILISLVCASFLYSKSAQNSEGLHVQDKSSTRAGWELWTKLKLNGLLQLKVFWVIYVIFFLFSTYFLFVWKEFLKNIPGSVLTSGLYDEWLGVPEQECEEKKVAAAQR